MRPSDTPTPSDTPHPAVAARGAQGEAAAALPGATAKPSDLAGRRRGPASGTARPAAAPRPAPAPAERGTLDLDKLYAARLQAARARPYLAAALHALHVVESWEVPTMGVDRHWRCYASPAFVDRLPVEELASVWVHEVSHLLRDHHGRGDRVARARGLTGPGDRLRMNIAADCEINDDAFGDGLLTPTGAVTPRLLGMPEGGVMEDYLDRFRLKRYTLHLTWLDCGSGADGMARPWELGPEGAHGLTAQERDAVRFRVAQGITGLPGDAPAGWRRWAEEVFHPPQPWRALLGAAIRSAVTGSGGRAGLHLRTPLAPLRRAARGRPAEPAPPPAAGDGGRRHLRLGERRGTRQRAAGGDRHLARGGRPAGPGVRGQLRRGGHEGGPAVPG